MTHKDIYTKFMIEYDKANVTSSYPSLTEYEVATVLDKAYNALIAQKVTGNNIRRVPLEGDLKSVVDLQSLVVSKIYPGNGQFEQIVDLNNDVVNGNIDNRLCINLPNDFLYYVGCQIRNWFDQRDGFAIDQYNSGADIRNRNVSVKLVSHQMAEKFMVSSNNVPWIKEPVCYIENNTLYILYDSYKQPRKDFCKITYVKQPNKFAKDLTADGLGISDEEMGQIKTISFFDYTLKVPSDDGYNQDDNRDAIDSFKSLYSFECNDTVAEELISLAVAFALENVESQRLNSKLNMRGLEG